MPKLNKDGKGIIGFIDVGSIGKLPNPWLENANIISKVLKFEPQEDTKNEINIINYDTALWMENTTRNFYIYKGIDSTGSSLFEQNFEYVRSNFEQLSKTGPKKLAKTWFDRSTLTDTLQLKCRTLDSVLSELDISFDFLKIDAQGAEYQILKGSETFLRSNCIGLHLELFVIPLYKGITLLPDVKDYLNGLGFTLKRKMPAHGSFNSQHDCIFLKENVDEVDVHKLNLIKKVYKIK